MHIIQCISFAASTNTEKKIQVYKKRRAESWQVFCLFQVTSKGTSKFLRGDFLKLKAFLERVSSV